MSAHLKYARTIEGWDGLPFVVLDTDEQKKYAERWRATVAQGPQGVETLRKHFAKYDELYEAHYKEYVDPEHPGYVHPERGQKPRPGPPCMGRFLQIHAFLGVYVLYLDPADKVYGRAESWVHEALENPYEIFVSRIGDDGDSRNFYKVHWRYYRGGRPFTAELEDECLAEDGVFANPQDCPPGPPREIPVLGGDSDDDEIEGVISGTSTTRNAIAGPSRLPQEMEIDNDEEHEQNQSQAVEDSDVAIIEPEEQISEKRKGKRRALSPEPAREPLAVRNRAKPTSRRSTTSRASHQIRRNTSPSVRFFTDEVPAMNYRNRPVVQSRRTSGNKVKTTPVTRTIKANKPRTQYKPRAPPPEPNNPNSERNLYRTLFDQDPPATRKQGAIFGLVEFRVVRADDNEDVEVEFTELIKEGSKKMYTVLGKVGEVYKKPGEKKEISEEDEEESEDDDPEEAGTEDREKSRETSKTKTKKKKGPTKKKQSSSTPVSQSSEPYDEANSQGFVRLIGGVDFRTVTRYKKAGFLKQAVELANLWSLAKLESIGGVHSEEELMEEVKKKLAEFKKGRKKNSRIDWQEMLPEWCRIDVRDLNPGEGVSKLLYQTLPEIPFVTPEIYKLVHRYFHPGSFRTDNRDLVEESEFEDKTYEEEFLAKVDEIVKATTKIDPAVELKEPLGVCDHPKKYCDQKAEGRRCDVTDRAKIDGKDYRSGDMIVVDGPRHQPWIARIIYFMSFFQDSKTTKEIHVEWLETHETITELGPYLPPRQLYRLTGTCDSILPETVSGKVEEFHQLGPSSPTPKTGYYARFIYSKVDNSFTCPPADFDDDLSTSDPKAPLCRKNEIRACRACEERLVLDEATDLDDKDKITRYVPFFAELENDSTFRFNNETYHIGDFVLIEPKNPKEPPPNSDPFSRTPLRLARLLAIKHGEEHGDADDRLGLDATIKVNWIYRREEAGFYKRGERVYEREVILSEITDTVPAHRLRGHFKLEHISTVGSLSSDPHEAHSKFNSDPLAFWTEFRVKVKHLNGSKEDCRSVRSGKEESIAREEVSNLRCSACHAAERDLDSDVQQITRSDASLALPNLALYAGAGFLDCGLQSGCPIMTMPFAVEKNEAAAEILKNAHSGSATQIFTEAVSDVSERSYFGEHDSVPSRAILSMSGGSPCQGFSMLNRHRRDDDVRTFEPFVFLSSMSVHRPLYAFFENVARFHEHSLPIPAPGTSDPNSPVRGSFQQLFLSVLLELGYQVRWSVYQAAEYGVPQSRRRFIVQATVPSIPLPEAPRPTHAYKPGRLANHALDSIERLPPGAPHRAVTVTDLSSDLPTFNVDPAVLAPSGFEWSESGGIKYLSPPLNDFQAKCRIDPLQEDFVVATTVTQHVCSAVTQEVAERLNGLGLESKTGETGNHEDLKGKPCYPAQPPFVAYNPKLRAEWYRRLRPSEVLSPLRTTLCLDGASHGARIHYKQARSLSVRELMRAQGVPDTIELFFSGLGREPTFVEVYRVIGNGVPVSLAEAFGRQLYKALLPIALRHAESGNPENVWETIWEENCAHLRASSQPALTARNSPSGSRDPSTSPQLDLSSADPRSSTAWTTPDQPIRRPHPIAKPIATSDNMDDSDSDSDLEIVSERPAR
ncbi:uncharacterized protein JCM6883_007160 [Sporobolomyces salmoneus]|uniref:uncharacterized protein n=1 Tax=Sporobolomyces salmoneus TaxID=183962 RepID=UPI00317809D2